MGVRYVYSVRACRLRRKFTPQIWVRPAAKRSEQLDELTRLGAPEMRLVPSSIDAARLLDDAADLWESRAAEKQVRIEKRAGVATFAADDALVRQVDLSSELMSLTFYLDRERV